MAEANILATKKLQGKLRYKTFFGFHFGPPFLKSASIQYREYANIKLSKHVLDLATNARH